MARNTRTIKYTNKDYDISKISYCFPGREWVLSSENCDICCEYGFMWPIPFISVFYGDKGKTYIAGGEGLESVRVNKTDKDLTVIFTYSREILENFIIEYNHDCSFRSSIRCFRSFFKQLCGEIKPMESNIKECFHVRRLFFNDCFCKRSIIHGNNICLEDIIDEDTEITGGSDVVLLFDQAYNRESRIRCGNEHPGKIQANLVPVIKKQMKVVRDKGVKEFFIYFDPYLVQRGSEWDRKFKTGLEIKDRDGKGIRVWGTSQWHPCTGVAKWQEASVSYIGEAMKELGAEGIYLDETGNGNQYKCFRKDHEHKPGDQIGSEHVYVRYIKKHFPESLMMSEFAPVYEMAKYFNIVMSDTRSVLNIYRFIFPEIRFIRIINCDRPLGHSEWEINKSFFNGEGLWIDNDLGNEEWYPENVKKLIKDQYLVFQKYSDCFSSCDVKPLIDIGSDEILANQFSGVAQEIITLLNTSETEKSVTLKGERFKKGEVLLQVEAAEETDEGIKLVMGGNTATAICLRGSSSSSVTSISS